MMLARLGRGLGVTHDEIAVEDPRFDHRLAPDPHHEQIAIAGHVGRHRDEFLDVLGREDVGTGCDVAHQRHMAHRPPVHGHAGVLVVSHLDGPGLGRMGAEVSGVAEVVEMGLDGGRRLQSHR